MASGWPPGPSGSQLGPEKRGGPPEGGEHDRQHDDHAGQLHEVGPPEGTPTTHRGILIREDGERLAALP